MSQTRTLPGQVDGLRRGAAAPSTRGHADAVGRLHELVAVARAQALFTSYLSAREPLTRAAADAAIRSAMRSLGGARGCAAQVAYAYGEDPQTAAARMRWARAQVGALYPAVPARVSIPRQRTAAEPAPAARAA